MFSVARNPVDKSPRDVLLGGSRDPVKGGVNRKARSGPYDGAMRYRHYRHECNYRVEVRTRQGRIPGWIANISASGARIEGLGEQQTGAPIAILLNGFMHSGRIVWCRKQLCGVRFDREIGKSDLERVRERQPGGGPAVHTRRIQSAGHHGFREL